MTFVSSDVYRQRGNGSSKYTSRLKAEDLRSLCGSVDGLRCVIREADALKVSKFTEVLFIVGEVNK